MSKVFLCVMLFHRVNPRMHSNAINWLNSCCNLKVTLGMMRVQSQLLHMYKWYSVQTWLWLWPIWNSWDLNHNFCQYLYVMCKQQFGARWHILVYQVLPLLFAAFPIIGCKL
jgi:hypothetical protein